MSGRYQGVTAFVGMPGSGKSYSLALVGHQAVKAGRCVWVNAGFDFGPALDCPKCGEPHVFTSMDAFAAIPAGVTVLFDEAPLYFNARRWQDFPDGVFYRLTQIRKDSLRLYYSTIDFDLVDANLRRLTFRAWECHAITGRLFWRARYRVRKGDLDGKAQRREFVIVRTAIAAQYDTMGKVAVPPSTKKKARDSATWAALSPDPAAKADVPAAASAPWWATFPQGG